jgi:hypothetical protein
MQYAMQLRTLCWAAAQEGREILVKRRKSLGLREIAIPIQPPLDRQ